jgi:hypothetical protein
MSAGAALERGRGRLPPDAAGTPTPQVGALGACRQGRQGAESFHDRHAWVRIARHRDRQVDRREQE